VEEALVRKEGKNMRWKILIVFGVLAFMQSSWAQDDTLKNA
jgi:hypothetical protein